jgi:GT2 family glycosyltransferase
VLSALYWLPTVLAGLFTAHTAVNAALLRWLPESPSTVDEPVAVLLPLRDEAARVAPCLRALLTQRGVSDLQVLVLDDGSTDGTADLVRAIAREMTGRDPDEDRGGAADPSGAVDPGGAAQTGGAAGPRVWLLAGGPPAEGWLGKPWACRQLADAAPARARVLAFLDADVRLGPHALAAAVNLLRDRGFGLLSGYPRLVAGSAAERLVQPLLPWSWLTFLPLRAMERSARPSLAAAGGQFLLVDRGAYQRAGGHAAVAGRVLEDVELARAVKRSGGRIGLATAHRQVACRMYTGWAQLRDGYTKSLWAALPGAGAVGVPALLALAYLAPLAVAPFAPVAGGCGYLLGVLGRVIAGRASGARTVPDAFAHPVSVVLFGVLVARSHVLHRRGRLVWKGREVW